MRKRTAPGRSQDFVWQCRSTDTSKVAIADRDAFLREEHWVVANARMGTHSELEYQIEMPDESQRLETNIFRA